MPLGLPYFGRTSLRLLFFLLLFSPEELSSLETNSLLLKLSLSCLDEDLEAEPREGVDFFSIFTFTFFFFFDLSLCEQGGQGSCAFQFPHHQGPTSLLKGLFPNPPTAKLAQRESRTLIG